MFLHLLLALSSTALALPRPQNAYPPPYPCITCAWPPPHWRLNQPKSPDAGTGEGNSAQPVSKTQSTVQVPGMRDTVEQRTTSSIVAGRDGGPQESGGDEKAGLNLILTLNLNLPLILTERVQVYICAAPSWGPPCTHFRTPLGSAPEACTALAPNMTALSIGPDPGFQCIFYTYVPQIKTRALYRRTDVPMLNADILTLPRSNAFCTPLASDGTDALPLSFPGTGDLTTTQKGDYDGRLLSFQCFREATEDSEEEPGLGVPPNVVLPQSADVEGERGRRSDDTA
ncbi:hypothetical protein SVAN01_03482 [Stagonosporopsis vannaccii]|nr:hypothetical protein SVAN01_03482 [Stagonosporopsis vannaccii]